VSRELFIYWRAPRGDLGAVLDAARSFQASLRMRHGDLSAALFQRPDDGGGTVTLMETYAAPAGIDALLEAEIVACGQPVFAPWCRGPRQVEAFERLPG
jgi:hypothetical protein